MTFRIPILAAELMTFLNGAVEGILTVASMVENDPSSIVELDIKFKGVQWLQQALSPILSKRGVPKRGLRESALQEGE